MNNNLARQRMVEQQIRVWDVTDQRVLAVLGEVPREQFVPIGRRGHLDRRDEI